MMKITILRNTFVMGEPASPGDELEVDDRTGRYLIAIRRATATVESSGVGPLETTSAAAIVETPEASKKAIVKKAKSE